MFVYRNTDKWRALIFWVCLHIYIDTILLLFIDLFYVREKKKNYSFDLYEIGINDSDWIIVFWHKLKFIL